MSLAFDFSTVIERLDRTVAEILRESEGTLFHDDGIKVFERGCSLSHCLEDMYRRGSKACLIHFSGGIPADRKYESPLRDTFLSRHMPILPCSTTSETQTPEVLDPNTSERLHKPAECSEGISTSIDSGTDFDVPTVLSITTSRGEALSAMMRKKYLFLDMRDVLRLLIECYVEAYGLHGEQTANAPAPSQFLAALLAIPVGEVANISTRNDYQCASDTETFRELLQKLEYFPKIPVFSETPSPKLLGVFTVTDFLKFLQEVTPSEIVSGFSPTMDPIMSFVSKKRHLTPLDNWTAGLIKAATHRSGSESPETLHVCFEDAPLLDGLKILYRTGFSALPIVSHANPRKCMSIFSVRDLQPILLRPERLCISGALFSLPILDYMSAIHQLESLKARYPVIHVKDDATVDAVFAKILATNIRRLFLTDNEGLLTGILSVTDLGRFVACEIARKP